MSYCCIPFQSHVDHSFFKEADWGDIPYGLYRNAPWAAIVIERKEEGLRLSPELDYNEIPLCYCPFCGKKLKGE